MLYKKFTYKKPYFLNPLSTMKNSRWYNSIESNYIQAQEMFSGTWMQPRLRRGHASPGGSGYGGPAWPPASHSDLKGLPQEIRILQLRLTQVFGRFLRFLKATCIFQWLLSTFCQNAGLFFWKFCLTPAENLYPGSQSLQKESFYLNSGHLSAHLLPLLGQPLGNAQHFPVTRGRLNAQHFPVTRGKIKRSALPCNKRED